jgi:hypothetical protein
MPGFTLYDAERRLVEDIIPGIQPFSEPIVLDWLAAIIYAKDRLCLAPCSPRRLVPVGVPIVVDPRDDLEMVGDSLLASLFSRELAWRHAPNRACYAAALAVARHSNLQPRLARKLGDTVSLALLARAGIRASVNDLPPFESSRLNAYSDENRGGGVSAVEQATREMATSGLRGGLPSVVIG